MRESLSTTAPRSDAEWLEIIEEWRGSGKSTREFCESRGIMLKTFQWRRWSLERRRRRHRSGPRTKTKTKTSTTSRNLVAAAHTPATAFIEVVDRSLSFEVGVGRDSGVEVVVAGACRDHRVRVDVGFDAGTLRQVVMVLREV